MEVQTNEQNSLSASHLTSEFLAIELYGSVLDWLDWICLTTTHVIQDILGVLHK